MSRGSPDSLLWRVAGIGPAAFAIATGVGVLVITKATVDVPLFLLRGNPVDIVQAVRRYGENAHVPARAFARAFQHLQHAAAVAALDAGVVTTKEQVGRP